MNFLKNIFFPSVFFLSFFAGVTSFNIIEKGTRKTTIVVSKDGKGDFTNIQEAVDAAVEDKTQTKIIIRKGTYREKIIIPETKGRIYFEGENALQTIIINNNFAAKKNTEGKEIGTTASSTIFIFSDNFSAKNITFQNDAGKVGQAVSALITGDNANFENCRFLGFQDTLYVKGNQDDKNPEKKTIRHYFKNCYIEGTTDFIFGAATAVFENCTIFAKEGASYITAASTPENTKYGFVFISCKIKGETKEQSVYLGRPWRGFAKTVFINCDMSNIIKPEGWHNWKKPEAEKTTFYAEYNSTGTGANPDKRVSWSHQLTKIQRKEYTPKKILKNNEINENLN